MDTNAFETTNPIEISAISAGEMGMGFSWSDASSGAEDIMERNDGVAERCTASTGGIREH